MRRKSRDLSASGEFPRRFEKDFGVGLSHAWRERNRTPLRDEVNGVRRGELGTVPFRFGTDIRGGEHEDGLEDFVGEDAGHILSFGRAG